MTEEKSETAAGAENAEDYSDVFDALAGLAAGDPTIHLADGGSDSLHDRLRRSVNEAASSLSSIVNMTHEFAMGLAENFGVLQSVTEGDLSARITSSSDQEILVCLKDLTNQTIDRLAGEIEERKATQEELALRYEELSYANRQVLDGMEYAWRIQTAIFPTKEKVSSIANDFLLFHKPKDVLGGDIYWLKPMQPSGYLAAIIDCTGHGVPGAFMTMIAMTSLDRVVLEKGITEPEEILAALNPMVKNMLNQHLPDAATDDGFDICVFRAYPEDCRLVFSGAKTDLYICDGKHVRRVKGDRHSIGYRSSNPNFKFTRHEVHLTPQTRFYVHTDGLTDQIGHRSGLPFGKSRFMEFLLETHAHSLADQQAELEKRFREHLGTEEQRDDVTVWGFGLDGRKGHANA